MKNKDFEKLIKSVGKFTGSRKFKVNNKYSDYDYVINEKDLSLFNDVLWEYYEDYNYTPFKTKAFYLSMNDIKYNIITYPDDFDLSIIDEVNKEMINTDVDITDKKIRIQLFEQLIKEKYEK